MQRGLFLGCLWLSLKADCCRIAVSDGAQLMAHDSAMERQAASVLSIGHGQIRGENLGHGCSNGGLQTRLQLQECHPLLLFLTRPWFPCAPLPLMLVGPFPGDRDRCHVRVCPAPSAQALPALASAFSVRTAGFCAGLHVAHTLLSPWAPDGFGRPLRFDLLAPEKAIAESQQGEVFLSRFVASVVSRCIQR